MTSPSKQDFIFRVVILEVVLRNINFKTLVHISEMSKKYIKHPMDVVSVGDTVKVKIIKIDYDKQKIGLTMKL